MTFPQVENSLLVAFFIVGFCLLVACSVVLFRVMRKTWLIKKLQQNYSNLTEELLLHKEVLTSFELCVTDRPMVAGDMSLERFALAKDIFYSLDELAHEIEVALFELKLDGIIKALAVCEVPIELSYSPLFSVKRHDDLAPRPLGEWIEQLRTLSGEIKDFLKSHSEPWPEERIRANAR